MVSASGEGAVLLSRSAWKNQSKMTVPLPDIDPGHTCLHLRVSDAFLEPQATYTGFLQSIRTFTVEFFFPLFQEVWILGVHFIPNTEGLYFTLLKVGPLPPSPWLFPHSCPPPPPGDLHLVPEGGPSPASLR